MMIPTLRPPLRNLLLGCVLSSWAGLSYYVYEYAGWDRGIVVARGVDSYGYHVALRTPSGPCIFVAVRDSVEYAEMPEGSRWRFKQRGHRLERKEVER